MPIKALDQNDSSNFACCLWRGLIEILWGYSALSKNEAPVKNLTHVEAQSICTTNSEQEYLPFFAFQEDYFVARGGVMGSGAFAWVYRAKVRNQEIIKHRGGNIKESDHEVAIKVIYIINRDQKYRTLLHQAIRREILSLSQFHHPNILRFIESSKHLEQKASYDSCDAYYIVTELAECSLANLLNKDSSSSRLRVQFQLEIMIRSIVMGLKAISDQKMLHRDIKPENLLVFPEGRITIADFGCVTAINEGSLSDRMKKSKENGRVVRFINEAVEGTLRYYPPEVLVDLAPGSSHQCVSSLGYFDTTRSDCWPAAITILALMDGSFQEFDPSMSQIGFGRDSKEQKHFADELENAAKMAIFRHSYNKFTLVVQKLLEQGIDAATIAVTDL